MEKEEKKKGAHGFANFGAREERPRMSCQTRTWPDVDIPLPMPIVGTEICSVTFMASSCGTHSITIEKHPASERTHAQ
jgi:hypothetical protein